MINPLGSRAILKVGDQDYTLFRLEKVYESHPTARRLPYSLKVLLENLLRFEDGVTVTAADIENLAGGGREGDDREIAFRPARVLMQDFTGVPAIVDLAAMRDAMKKLGGNPEKINPLAEVDLVIDHSVMVDNFGGRDSFKKNVAIEYERNAERYRLMKWATSSLAHVRAHPPGTGIMHTLNLERLATVVACDEQDGIV